jgi:hypothetical protein
MDLFNKNAHAGVEVPSARRSWKPGNTSVSAKSTERTAAFYLPDRLVHDLAHHDYAIPHPLAILRWTVHVSLGSQVSIK